MNSFSTTITLGERVIVEGKVSMGVVMIDFGGVVETTTSEAEEATSGEGVSTDMCMIAAEETGQVDITETEARAEGSGGIKTSSSELGHGLDLFRYRYCRGTRLCPDCHQKFHNR